MCDPFKKVASRRCIHCTEQNEKKVICLCGRVLTQDLRQTVGSAVLTQVLFVGVETMLQMAVSLILFPLKGVDQHGSALALAPGPLVSGPAPGTRENK
jgi:hypothetical protein